MSKASKKLLIFGVSALTAGIIIAGIAFGIIISAANSSGGSGTWFDSFGTVSYVSNTYTTAESFENIDIRCGQSDIRFVLSDELTTSRVECSETENVTHKVEVRDNTLFITLEDNSTWLDYVGVNLGTVSAVVYLPQSTFQTLSVKASSGDIDIPDTFTFAGAKLCSSSGDITCLAQIGLNSTDGIALTVETSSGKVIIETKTTMETLSVSTSSGDISINNTAADTVSICTASGRIETFNLSAGRYDESISFVGGKCSISASSGDIKLSSCEFGECSISTASGRVRLDGVDANTYDISTASGDVTGTIRSYKNFITSTSSGSIDVPSSNPDNGDCRISTTSGDIDIKVVF